MKFHVGEYLNDELLARGWTTRDCAERMGGDVDIDQLTLDLTIAAWQAPEGHSAKRTTMARETAEGLAKAFGTDAETWLRLDDAGREDCDCERMEERIAARLEVEEEERTYQATFDQFQPGLITGYTLTPRTEKATQTQPSRGG